MTPAYVCRRAPASRCVHGPHDTQREEDARHIRSAQTYAVDTRLPSRGARLLAALLVQRGLRRHVDVLQHRELGPVLQPDGVHLLVDVRDVPVRAQSRTRAATPLQCVCGGRVRPRGVLRGTIAGIVRGTGRQTRTSEPWPSRASPPAAACSRPSHSGTRCAPSRGTPATRRRHRSPRRAAPASEPVSTRGTDVRRTRGRPSALAAKRIVISPFQSSSAHAPAPPRPGSSSSCCPAPPP